ncbi:M50 family metallopeptidase [Bacillus timonensis]|nr:M50 family metallopeptidase [Bacillus timonensis]
MIDHWLFYLVLAYIVSILPVVGRYVAVFNTLIHEDGHAIVALILKGKVLSISLFSTTEGEAVTAYRCWIARVLTGYAGYTFSSVVAYVSFALLTEGEVMLVLYGFIAIAVVNLFLWVRNAYGIVWLLSFIVISVAVLKSNSGQLQMFYTFFLSAVLLTQSISSAFEIFVLSWTRRKEAGDATSLAEATFLPAFFWGTLFFAQSLYIGYLVMIDFVV